MSTRCTSASTAATWATIAAAHATDGHADGGSGGNSSVWISASSVEPRQHDLTTTKVPTMQNAPRR
jgi:hypothetical protein